MQKCLVGLLVGCVTFAHASDELALYCDLEERALYAVLNDRDLPEKEKYPQVTMGCLESLDITLDMKYACCDHYQRIGVPADIQELSAFPLKRYSSAVACTSLQIGFWIEYLKGCIGKKGHLVWNEELIQERGDEYLLNLGYWDPLSKKSFIEHLRLYGAIDIIGCVSRKDTTCFLTIYPHQDFSRALQGGTIRINGVFRGSSSDSCKSAKSIVDPLNKETLTGLLVGGSIDQDLYTQEYRFRYALTQATAVAIALKRCLELSSKIFSADERENEKKLAAIKKYAKRCDQKCLDAELACLDVTRTTFFPKKLSPRRKVKDVLAECAAQYKAIHSSSL